MWKTSPPEPVRVPAAEVPDFLRGHFHALARSLPVTSSDGSFEAPTAPPAMLVLDARFEPNDVLRLAWSWEHADGRTSPVEASAADTAVEDPELDDDLLGRVIDELGWVPLDAVILRGLDAAEFTAERMPRLESLAEHGGLRIDVDTFKGVVTLSGRVKTKEEEAKAMELARKIRGVTDVKSSLQIQP